MPKVIIKFFATIKDELGVKELELDCDGTLKDLLEKAEAMIGEKFNELIYDKQRRSFRSDLIVLVNGRGLEYLEGMETKLNEGDVVAVFPQIAGGL